MSCAEFAADLSAWIDRELPEARAADVTAHVATCAACRAHADGLRRADRELRAIPLRDLRPDALAEVLRRAGGGARAELARAARWARWAAAAGAAAALAFYFAATRSDPLDAASPEDLAVAIDLDTVEDLDVIANLEMLEAMVALEEEGRG
ncbi:MAG TPA: zf-HC2 domain-containing protein [Myxococcota bacterium]|nr:zf-HC2 domain-containing protein [Myxococcota bacterium]